ncbi:MAG: hypothetical protein KAI39_09205 [Desulfobulbaceae bacterium]|nr:hypothetical protein [Desulfobulbaceae bacterium]
MNEQGKQCPACKLDIGIWPILKAPLPTMMRCPHCKVPVQYDESGWGVILIVIVMIMPIIYIIGSNMNFIYTMNPLPMAAIIGGTGLLIWLPFELLMAFYLRKNQELIIKVK